MWIKCWDNHTTHSTTTSKFMTLNTAANHWQYWQYFCSFPQSPQATSGTPPQISYDWVLSQPLQFITDRSSEQSILYNVSLCVIKQTKNNKNNINQSCHDLINCWLFSLINYAGKKYYLTPTYFYFVEGTYELLLWNTYSPETLYNCAYLTGLNIFF